MKRIDPSKDILNWVNKNEAAGESGTALSAENMNDQNRNLIGWLNDLIDGKVDIEDGKVLIDQEVAESLVGVTPFVTADDPKVVTSGGVYLNLKALVGTPKTSGTLTPVDTISGLDTRVKNAVSNINTISSTVTNLAEVAKSGKYSDLVEKLPIDSAISTTSINPVQNKAIDAHLKATYEPIIDASNKVSYDFIDNKPQLLQYKVENGALIFSKNI